MKRTAIATTVLGALVSGAITARADSTSGVDSALFRPSYDNTGVFSLDGAQPLEARDLVWKLLLGYAQRPLAAPVPGIGGSGGSVDTATDDILKSAATLDFTFALALTHKLVFGFDTAAYSASPGAGYGKRGRYSLDPTAAVPSTGLLSLRPLTNLDPSGSSADASLNQPISGSGPLDVRVGFKYALTTGPKLSTAVLLSAMIPFGEEQMFLGDTSFVVEPKLAVDYRFDRIKATKLVANVSARLRRRTVLEAFDPATQTADQAQVVMDVGSEVTAGAGAVIELSPRVMLGLEDVWFVPLPSGIDFGDCRRNNGAKCSTITKSDYFANGGYGDLASYAMAGLTVRATESVGVQVLAGTGYLGHRADQFHVAIGLTWSPQPAGAADLSRSDKDGDGIPDSVDACPDEPEDKDGFQDDDGCPDLDNDGDGIPDINDSCPNEPEDKDNFQDEDGCPDRDNDGDGIPDVTDKCPNDKEDFDGFQDEDGCPDDDNDGDGFPDNVDKCPNDPETVNGVDDDDGCPDTRSSTGPVEAADRINLQGARIEFAPGGDKLTSASQQLLKQVAQLLTGNKKLAVRVEVHVALGTKSKSAAAIKAQKAKDKALSQRRADAVAAFLLQQGVGQQQIAGAAGIGSDRPLGSNAPDDPNNDRVDFIKTSQSSPTRSP